MRATATARGIAIALAIAGTGRALAGCGGGEPTTCTLGERTGCAEGLVCEAVEGGDPACFAPVVIEGRVLDALEGTGIAGARVVAVDANGAARSSVVLSAADGAYSLPVAARRAADGSAVADQLTLRADAAGYQTYPTPPRAPIPVELSGATDADGDGDAEVVSAATDIALLPREDVAGTARVAGTLEASDPGGALVIAEVGGRAVASGITAEDGSFVLFDVPVGAATIDAYRAGLAVAAASVTVVAPETAGVVLVGRAEGLGTVTGSVQIVNAPGGSRTSVILVVESTFVENVARGEAPPGLRAAPVTGAFTIDGVPPGRYVALAAFENDGLVRDPDTSIGGTAIVHVEVPDGGGVVELGESFKVTGALAVRSPGAEVVETIATAEPTFRWEDDSSEDGYELRVFDAFGNLVHENTMLPRVTGSGDVTYTWTGATLEPGMLYQFRAWSFHDEASGHVLISATEDLRGAFVYEP